MTDPNYTAIGIVLDRSGSMSSIKGDAEGALKEFIATQKAQPGKLSVTLTRFDDTAEVAYVNRDIHTIDGILIEPRRATALLDAIGMTITMVGEDLAAMDEDKRPGKVLFVIVTDGYENASKEWTYDKINEAISRQRDEFSWEFIFLAANQDAIQTGTKMGVPVANNMVFAATGEGVQRMTKSVSTYVSDYRKSGEATLK